MFISAKLPLSSHKPVLCFPARGHKKRISNTEQGMSNDEVRAVPQHPSLPRFNYLTLIETGEGEHFLPYEKNEFPLRKGG